MSLHYFLKIIFLVFRLREKEKFERQKEQLGRMQKEMEEWKESLKAYREQVWVVFWDCFLGLFSGIVFWDCFLPFAEIPAALSLVHTCEIRTRKRNIFLSLVLMLTSFVSPV